ncbi:MAG: glutamyl-tRNA reductase, partial [Dehalococcoidia bacterium]|nr:glutamyl-tRNA reductase [Dehalococcoidia bacterium]
HEELAVLMEDRDQRPLLVIDTAVPRDFDPAVRNHPNVHLYDIDDLQKIVERRAGGRRAEALKAQAVVEVELARFERWVESLEVIPTITQLRQLAQQIAQRAIDDNEGKWDSLSESDRRRVELLANTVVNRLLHGPTARLKQAVDGGETPLYVEAVRELFGLGEGADKQGAAVTPSDSEKSGQTPRPQPASPQESKGHRGDRDPFG